MLAKTRHAAVAALLVMTASLVVETQSATEVAKLPAFEVATVKLHKDAPRNFWLDPGGRFTITGFTLRDLIRAAYGSDESTLQTAAQFLGGPSWIAVDRFDIAAKAEGDVYPNQAGGIARLLGMLNRLITERFRLVVHTEMREMPIYLLVLAKKDGTLGPGLHPSTIDCPEPKSDQAPAPPDPVRWCGFRGVGSGIVSGQGVTFAQMATTFSGYAEVRRPVFDRTGLTGKFDLHIESAPGLPGPNVDASLAPNPQADSRPSVFTALQEQLGLKLESTKGLVDVLVIDHAEKPAPD